MAPPCRLSPQAPVPLSPNQPRLRAMNCTATWLTEEPTRLSNLHLVRSVCCLSTGGGSGGAAGTELERHPPLAATHVLAPAARLPAAQPRAPHAGACSAGWPAVLLCPAADRAPSAAEGFLLACLVHGRTHMHTNSRTDSFAHPQVTQRALPALRSHRSQ